MDIPIISLLILYGFILLFLLASNNQSITLTETLLHSALKEESSINETPTIFLFL